MMTRTRCDSPTVPMTFDAEAHRAELLAAIRGRPAAAPAVTLTAEQSAAVTQVLRVVYV